MLGALKAARALVPIALFALAPLAFGEWRARGAALEAARERLRVVTEERDQAQAQARAATAAALAHEAARRPVERIVREVRTELAHVPTSAACREDPAIALAYGALARMFDAAGAEPGPGGDPGAVSQR